MAPLTLVRPRWLHGLPGLQSHHRSILLWPDLLDESAWCWVGALLHTGSRVISFDRALPERWTGSLLPVALEVWSGGGPAGSGAQPDAYPVAYSGSAGQVDLSAPSRAEWDRLTALWAAGSLTPLPAGCRLDPAWRHARARRDGRLVACASLQALRAPVGGHDSLVCCVAADPVFRRSGAARSCAQALGDLAGPAAALIEPGSGSGPFFHALGWRPSGLAHLYRHT